MPAALIIGGTLDDRVREAHKLAGEHEASLIELGGDDLEGLRTSADDHWILLADARRASMPMQSALCEAARERVGFMLLGFSGDPQDIVNAGEFREDLYWHAARNVITVGQQGTRSSRPVVDGFEAATAESPAPKDSRAYGDPFTNLIMIRDSDTPIIRFWHLQSGSKLCPVDYEVLDPRFEDIDVVHDLILQCYFVELTQHYYRDIVEVFSIARLGSTNAVEVPYPL